MPMPLHEEDERRWSHNTTMTSLSIFPMPQRTKHDEISEKIIEFNVKYRDGIAGLIISWQYHLWDTFVFEHP